MKKCKKIGGIHGKNFEIIMNNGKSVLTTPQKLCYNKEPHEKGFGKIERFASTARLNE